ncbi:MAG: hypothetical protein LBT09_03900 [Planctomycetaceae bacterium]|jgi:hypothetical protein|nr:hypothetical protein [Planctomycetaceae bacterium]
MKTLTQRLKETGILDQLLAEFHNEIRDEVRAEECAKRQADKIEMARKLKYHGMDHELIMEITGLSLEEVKRLR